MGARVEALLIEIRSLRQATNPLFRKAVMDLD